MTMSSARGARSHATTHRRRRLGAVVTNLGSEPKESVPARQTFQQGNKRQSKQHPDDTYKTEMCNNWIEFGSCRYNHKCRFAHGEEELRVARRIASEKKWKSEYCRNYHTDGTCSYGRRCHFIHDETEEELRRMHRTQKRVGGWRRVTKKSERTNENPHVANAQIVSPPAKKDSALEGGQNGILSSRSGNIFASQHPTPLKRSDSLLEFCKEYGLPTEDDENTIHPSNDPWSNALVTEPFLCENPPSFASFQDKPTFQQETQVQALAQAESILMDSQSRLPRLAVFKRIASDTGVAMGPPSPTSFAP